MRSPPEKPLATSKEPQERALRQLVEAVLYEGLAQLRPASTPRVLEWRLGGRHYRARGTIGPFGRPRLEPASVQVEGVGGSWRPADLEALVDALPADAESRRCLMAELSQTIELCRWNRDNLSLADRRSLPFAALDSALGEGHPYHPCFKSRTGFSPEDHARFGPESAQPFRLEWLAVRRSESAFSLSGTEADFWHHELGAERDVLADRLAEMGQGFQTHALLPVHPWQMRHLAQGILQPWFADGRAVALGVAGPRYVASQSLRTLHNFDQPGASSVKLALSVVSTSSLRILDPHFVLTGPALSGWLARIVASDPLLRGRYRMDVLAEHAAALVDWDGPLAGHLAAIWRESPKLAPGEAAVPFNALTALEADQTAFVAPWLSRYGLHAWLDRLVEVAVMPVWHLLVAQGVALEAHGQNMILVHRDGWPERIILRDFHESAEYAPDFVLEPDTAPDFGAIDPAHAGPVDDRFHAMRSPAVLAELVTDALFVFNLAELTHLLCCLHALDEPAFWQRLGRRLLRHAIEHGLEDRLALIGIDAPRLKVEALLSRKLGLGEEASSHLVPNALLPFSANPREVS
ncbi:rhizobactin siderophore biosynthesis protein RhsF [Boseaceae bacterium BT-24-1]|nr:rhizobactin siderophore biosynthesis protein RhsF [Boseaceae bacterium BT-24-1]